MLGGLLRRPPSPGGIRGDVHHAAWRRVDGVGHGALGLPVDGCGLRGPAP
jgi:hypothetical protein